MYWEKKTSEGESQENVNKTIIMRRSDQEPVPEKATIN